MTKKELIEKLEDYDDYQTVLVDGNDGNHYEVTDIDTGYYEDLEEDCIILYS